MKFLLFFLLLCLSLAAQAVHFEVLGRQGQSLFQTSSGVKLPSTVGLFTVHVFDAFEVPYEGGDAGIASIYGVGQDIDVISDTEMKAYGWCFAIDGVVAETMPDKTVLAKPTSHIVWFYGYAHYKNGQWVAQCATDYDF